MKLPYLDQLVPLERGEAELLARALDVLVGDVTTAQEPVQPIDMLFLTPLHAMAKRLHRRAVAEQARPPKPGHSPKPWNYRTPYDQMVALLFLRGALECCGLEGVEAALLLGIIGKFQQKSLNLNQFIKFQ